MLPRPSQSRRRTCLEPSDLSSNLFVRYRQSGKSLKRRSFPVGPCAFIIPPHNPSDTDDCRYDEKRYCKPDDSYATDFSTLIRGAEII